MKKRLIAALLALTLALALPAALAADTRIESLEYKGFGVIKVEFTRETQWNPGATFTLTDGSNTAVTATPFASEDEEAYLYAPDIADGAAYTLQFTLGATDQTIPFTADTALDHRISKSDEVTAREDKEKCDFCRTPGHDEDFCPERINPGDVPTDISGLAWYFDIDELCERCRGFGHDDERCPN